MEPDSQIVIGPDGTVLAATGDLPPGLVDLYLRKCDGLSREIRDAGQGRLTLSDVEVDFDTRQVHRGRHATRLTPKEYDLLRYPQEPEEPPGLEFG